MAEVNEIIKLQDENVTRTGEIFGQVKDGVSASIEGIHKIAEMSFEMEKARERVTDVVQSLASIAEENAASTEETSASVAQVDEIAGNIQELSKDMEEIVKTLNVYIKQFTVE